MLKLGFLLLEVIQVLFFLRSTFRAFLENLDGLGLVFASLNRVFRATHGGIFGFLGRFLEVHLLSLSLLQVTKAFKGELGAGRLLCDKCLGLCITAAVLVSAVEDRLLGGTK
jgi:hypothetical protein